MMDFDGLCAYVKVHFPNSFSIGEPMKDHTTFAIGGPADLFVTVREAKALQALLKKARDCDVPYLILGKGSNMLVRDGGIRGLVVHLDEGGAQLVTGYELRAGGGVPLSQVSQLAAAHGLGGLTFAIGIPGSLGGAVLMNAGAYGGEMSDVIKEVTFLDENLDFQTAKATDLSYSYRHSYFMDHPGCVIVEASWSYGLRHPVKSKRKWRTLRNAARKSSPWSTPVRAAPSNVRPVIIQVPLSGRQVLPALSWAALK